MRRKSFGERVAGELGDRACELHAGRPAADDHEPEQPLAGRGVVLDLGGLERSQDAAANQRRVVDALQARRERLPFLVAEVRMRRARCDDQIVERERPVVQRDLVFRSVDAGDLGEQHAHVALAAQDRADRPRDVGRRQARGRDLIQQRLKQVVVVPVDERHVRRDFRERARGEQPAEPGAEDHDAGTLCAHGNPPPLAWAPSAALRRL